MSGIRTNAAAELLGVSPNTLRSWERRFDYPRPRRTEGGHRQYELADLEALRRALLDTHNISSAVEIARERGEGPTSPVRLVEAFDGFDEQAADRTMEESLAVRSPERTVQELLLPALELANERHGRESEAEFGCRWATGWLHAHRRVVAPATRSEGVLIFDSSNQLGAESLQVQALELAVRRAGFRTLLLSVALEQERLVRAIRGTEPMVVVLAGDGATLDVVGRVVYAARHGRAPIRVVEFRGATPVRGKHSITSLGSSATEAVAALKQIAEAPASAQPLRRDDEREHRAPAAMRAAAAGAVRSSA